MKEVYILGGLRTPIGLKDGQFKKIRPEVMGAAILDELMTRYKLGKIDEVLCGNAVGTGGNIGRLMTLLSKAGEETPACTIDMQCASAAASIEFGYAKLRAGLADTIVAGGIESSSLQPSRSYALGDDRKGEFTVAQFSPKENDPLAMLKGAERTACRIEATKAELDRAVLRSHENATQAAREGYLEAIKLPINGITTDEGIRPTMSQRLLSRMPLFFGKDSHTHAGNSCFTHDGAAFVVLTSQEGLENYRERTTTEEKSSKEELDAFRLVDAMPWGGEPLYSPQGAGLATEALVKRNKLTVQELDAIEWNEAFAVIDVLFERAYPDKVDCYNIFGGALAYGHPYGASGAIILLHLMEALRCQQGRYGVCAIAGAGGMGCALLVERIKA